MGAVARVMFNHPHFLHLLLSSVAVADAFPGDREAFDAEQDLLNLPPVVEETDNSCPRTHECISKEHCYHYQEDLDELRNMTVGSKEYNELFAELGQMVCNKEEKGYCCSTIEENVGWLHPSSPCCSECRFNLRRNRCVSIATRQPCHC